MLDRYDQDLLLDYLEGELEGDRLAQFENDLTQDPQLALLLGEMANDRAALRALPREQAPADLIHDLTQSLERRMLLDDAATDAGPIPITRGRDLASSPNTGAIHWGRVAGLSGLAASVAIAAGVVVLMQENDQLINTAERLAQSTQPAAVDKADGHKPELLAAIDPAAAPATTAGAQPSIAAIESDATRPSLPGGRGGELRGTVSPEAGSFQRGVREPSDQGIGGDRLAIAPNSISEDSARRLNTTASSGELTAALAFAATPPRQQLVLYTEEPGWTREQLVTLCVDNNIPIVQTNLNTPSQIAAQAPANQPELDENTQTDAQAVGSDSFALLVSDEQLDKLLYNFNGDVPVSKEKLGKRSAFANQAAVVTELDLSNDVYAEQKLSSDNKIVPDAPEALDSHASDAVESQLQYNGTAQAIELRLPQDLGSEYANDRNRINVYNGSNTIANQYQTQYKLSNQAKEQPEAESAKAAHDLWAAGNPDSDDASLTQRSKQYSDGANAPEPIAPLTDTVANPAHQAPEGDPHAEEASPRDAGSLRGNWLAPYLPLAQTTPILNWQYDVAAVNPQRLVPIMIRQAPPDEVRSLRSQQRAAYGQANERSNTALKEEAQQPREAAPADTSEPAAVTRPADESRESN